jgi:hypothetical protein
MLALASTSSVRRERLLDAVLEDDEVGGVQAADGVLIGVGDRDSQGHHIDRGAKRGVRLGGVRRGLRDGQCGRNNEHDSGANVLHHGGNPTA